MAWAADRAGPVTSQRELTGGRTSRMLALTHADGTRSVLRVIEREPWLTHRAELTTREHETQLALAGSGVPAPRSLALDAANGRHLMTLLPGVIDEGRASDADLLALAETLAAIHDVRPEVPPRAYQSWAWEAKYVAPAWSTRPDVWREAFDVLRSEPPGFEPTFLHRDFGPHNVIWDGPALSGVVDWVETSTGPAWLDVAHCSTNIAVRHGVDRARAFAAAYTAATGRAREAYWEVMDVVGFIPPPGGQEWFTEPTKRVRLEDALASGLGALSARRRP